MPVPVNYTDYTLVDGNKTWDSTENYEVYYLTGSPTLTGDRVMTDDGGAVKGMKYKFLYKGNIDLNGHTYTIFGHSLSIAEAATSNLIIEAWNIGGAYMTTCYVTAGVEQISTDDIADEAVTLDKMADLTRGSIIVGGASNRPTALDVKTAGAVPIGDGTDIAAHTITGDITVNSAGVSAIGAGVIVNADVSATAVIAVSKLEAMTNGQIITGLTGAPSIPVIRTLSSDLAIANTGAATIQSAVVSPSKMTTNAKTQPLATLLSLEVDGGKYSITMSGNGTITGTSANCNDAIVANCNVAIDINGTPVTGGTVSWTAGNAANTNNAGTAVTANNNYVDGDVINFTITTTGGETATVTHSIEYIKTN